jgi:hypothetical protein
MWYIMYIDKYAFAQDFDRELNENCKVNSWFCRWMWKTET